jgi:hypothetical protein
VEVKRQTTAEKIDNRETYPHHDLIKWMKKEEAMNRQQRWKKGVNEMRNRKTSASWQNDTAHQKRTNDYIPPQNGIYQSHPPTRNRKN